MNGTSVESLEIGISLPELRFGPIEKIEQSGETLVRVNVSAATQDGETVLGSALIALDQHAER